jgi:hypothetical protein
MNISEPKLARIDFPFQSFINAPQSHELAKLVVKWESENQESISWSSTLGIPSPLQQGLSEYLQSANPGLPLFWCDHIAATAMFISKTGGFRLGSNVGFQG